MCHVCWFIGPRLGSCSLWLLTQPVSFLSLEKQIHYKSNTKDTHFLQFWKAGPFLWDTEVIFLFHYQDYTFKPLTGSECNYLRIGRSQIVLRQHLYITDLFFTSAPANNLNDNYRNLQRFPSIYYNQNKSHIMSSKH